MKTQTLWSIKQGVSKNLLDLGIKVLGSYLWKRKVWPCL